MALSAGDRLGNDGKIADSVSFSAYVLRNITLPDRNYICFSSGSGIGAYVTADEVWCSRNQIGTGTINNNNKPNQFPER